MKSKEINIIIHYKAFLGNSVLWSKKSLWRRISQQTERKSRISLTLIFQVLPRGPFIKMRRNHTQTKKWNKVLANHLNHLSRRMRLSINTFRETTTFPRCQWESLSFRMRNFHLISSRRVATSKTLGAWSPQPRWVWASLHSCSLDRIKRLKAKKRVLCQANKDNIKATWTWEL